MPRRSILATCVLVWLIGSAPGVATAQVVINNGLDPETASTNILGVGSALPLGTSQLYVQDLLCNALIADPCLTPGIPTTVSYFAGGVLNMQAQVRENSSFIVFANRVFTVHVRENASADFVSSGASSFLAGFDDAVIHIDSIGAQGTIELFDNAYLRTLSGIANSIALDGSSTSEIDDLFVPHVTLSGQSRLSMNGGHISTQLSLMDQSDAHVIGGVVANLRLDDQSTATLVGGADVTASIVVLANAVLRIEGDAFTVDGSPVPFGPLAALAGDLVGTSVSGLLVDVPFARTATATIELVDRATATPSPFTGLGDLPGGRFLSKPSSLSDDGRVVVGVSQSSFGEEAFRWTRETGMTSLDGLDGIPLLGSRFRSLAVDTDGDGSTVVGNSNDDAGASQGFVWTNGGMSTPLAIGGSISSAVNGISSNGGTLAGNLRTSANRIDGFALINGVFSPLGQITGGGDLTNALAVSRDGVVVVGEDGLLAGDRVAFRWTQAGGIQGLGDLPGGAVYSIPRGISADGSMIFGISSGVSGFEGFRWESGVMTSFGQIPPGLPDAGAFFLPGGASDDGSIVVGTTGLGQGVAYMWSAANGFEPMQAVLAARGISIGAWQLTSANRVSSDGLSITGEGINPEGRIEAWYVPEPVPIQLGPAMLLTLALLARWKPGAPAQSS